MLSFFLLQKKKLHYNIIYSYDKLNNLFADVCAGYHSKATYTSMYRICLYEVPATEYTSLYTLSLPRYILAYIIFHTKCINQYYRYCLFNVNKAHNSRDV